MSSKELYSRALKLFPKGVNSPVRFYEPYPTYFSKAAGTRLFDVDGKEYLDFCMGFGANFVGYSNENIAEEIMYLLDDSIPEGVPTENEIILGEIIQSAVPSVEMMRFTNSGTEATMHAIRLARAYTGRTLILKMNAGFHGAHDYVLVSAGSGALNFGTPSSPGIPEEVSKTVIVGDFNNEESIRELFRKYGKNIAAVITEPVLGNIGTIGPKKGFLKFLREITEEYGSLLIFDEVITGFRFHFGAYQDLINVKPDLTTMGKIIGGGMPVGLFGGRREIMERISPQGDVYQSGTFSANPFTVAAGIATLNFLKTRNYEYTHSLAGWVQDKLSPFRDMGVQVNRVYNMFTIFFNDGVVDSYASALRSDKNKFMDFFRHSKEHGIYFSPGQFETSFVGMAHTPEEVEMAVFKMVYTLEFDMNENRNEREQTSVKTN
jgi:glutamate-1-semialdehyde 2,1-aminomutase